MNSFIHISQTQPNDNRESDNQTTSLVFDDVKLKEYGLKTREVKRVLYA